MITRDMSRDAFEAFVSVAAESSGDVESPVGFFARFCDRIAVVDSDGMCRLFTFASVSDAVWWFDELSAVYDAWEDQ